MRVTQMTSLIRVHTQLSGLAGQRRPQDSNMLLNVLGMIIDPMLRHLDLQHVSLLARTCQTLRVLTSDEQLLYFILQFLPLKNAQDTRRMFLIPRIIALDRVAVARYSQQHAFVHAMKTHSGLEGFRRAAAERRAMVDRRRARARVREALLECARLRRRKLFTAGLEVMGLPYPILHFPLPINVRFLTDFQNITFENEDFMLSVLLEALCWEHYLHEFTDFKDRVKQRVEIMGPYPGLTNDIQDEFTRPVVWPWLA
jgi:hypothetical protein